MKFKEMNLATYIVKGLEDQGIETATEIQATALPLIKSGADVIGLSQTGSGKTYAYGIPALECIDTELSAVQVLVVCPTRELAAQVAEDLRKLTSLTSKIGIAPIFGGSSMDRQVQALKRGAKIVIGTPGRLMDHLRRKTLKLDKLSMVVLDEADEMLNMGFKEDIETILKTTPNTRQTVMFSATMPPEIIRITKQYMKEPVLIKAKNQDSAPALIKQYYSNCNKTEKAEVLKKIYEKFNPWISIVFCNTIRMVDELCSTLKKSGLPVVALHGDMRQNERKRVMESFKKNSGGGILIATDVAARGIDIKNVDIVVNYDFPNNEDYYVHRIGRTGRAGKEGIAFTIINTKDQAKDLQSLINKTGSRIEEYASLSTTKWSLNESNGRESKQSNRREPREHGRNDFQKRYNNERPHAKRLEQRREDKRNESPLQKREFRQSNERTGRTDSFKRVIGKPNSSKDIETFVIGSDATNFRKSNPSNQRFGGNASKRNQRPYNRQNNPKPQNKK